MTEEQMYDAILTAVQEFEQNESDFTTWESLNYVELSKMVKENREPAENAARNCILLMLALCPSRSDGIDLRGVDIDDLSPRERAKVLASVRDALF
jgi:hypothetical protein